MLCYAVIYDMIWYDMIYDMIYDMVWYGMVWPPARWAHGLLWWPRTAINNVVFCLVKNLSLFWYCLSEIMFTATTTWYGMIWYANDVMWCDVMWWDVIWYDMIWYDMIWYMMYDVIWYIIYILYVMWHKFGGHQIYSYGIKLSISRIQFVSINACSHWLCN